MEGRSCRHNESISLIPGVGVGRKGKNGSDSRVHLTHLSETSVHLCSKLFPMLIRTEKPNEKLGLFLIRPMLGTRVIDCPSQ